mmetsp:Transcript_35707/g.47106  ORF Transcript_35707/g.47106 Transcript_35707/m.47106 type:complete len:114 (-) Transcript_35707:360-701(-)
MQFLGLLLIISTVFHRVVIAEIATKSKTLDLRESSLKTATVVEFNRLAQSCPETECKIILVDNNCEQTGECASISVDDLKANIDSRKDNLFRGFKVSMLTAGLGVALLFWWLY